MPEITYVKGDVLSPVGDDGKVICHVCNNRGGWGKGFVVALSRKWPDPESAFRKVFNRELGTCEFVEVPHPTQLYVANMIAQDGYSTNGRKALSYEFLETCLEQVNTFCINSKSSLHMPRIGCGLGGGDWDKVCEIIERTITVDVTVYDLVERVER